MNKDAEYFARQQKEISVSEFFEKNKHLLGFDNPTKALMMVVKEAVDNALDACEEAGILPDIKVKVKPVSDDVYRITVEDNGPGIVKESAYNIFGKFLFGSKFHRLRQNRGQQGIGIKAAVLYAQLTTGKPTKIWSRTGSSKYTNYIELMINTMKNEPDIIKEDRLESGINSIKEHGVRIEFEIKGRYRKTQGVDDYLKQTAIVNPFASIAYQSPDGTKTEYTRAINELPPQPREIKPHPRGVELGILLRMLKSTQSRSLTGFLINDFSRIGSTSAKEILKIAKLDSEKNPKHLSRDEAEKLMNAMQKIKIQKPPTDCLSPIGEKGLEEGLKKEYPEADFVATVCRSPDVYRGNPFQIEVGIVYGSPLKQDDSVTLFRLANKVPLMYQQGACAITEAVTKTTWKRYGLQQSGQSMPSGPAVIVVHMASVWVPFVSESKEAIASYPKIIKEMQLALQDCGRKLSRFLSGRRRAGEAQRRIQIFEKYAKEASAALHKLTGKDSKQIEKMFDKLINLKTKKGDTGENDKGAGN